MGAGARPGGELTTRWTTYSWMRQAVSSCPLMGASLQRNHNARVRYGFGLSHTAQQMAAASEACAAPADARPHVALRVRAQAVHRAVGTSGPPLCALPLLCEVADPKHRRVHSVHRLVIQPDGPAGTVSESHLTSGEGRQALSGCHASRSPLHWMTGGTVTVWQGRTGPNQRTSLRTAASARNPGDCEPGSSGLCGNSCADHSKIQICVTHSARPRNCRGRVTRRHRVRGAPHCHRLAELSLQEGDEYGCQRVQVSLVCPARRQRLPRYA